MTMTPTEYVEDLESIRFLARLAIGTCESIQCSTRHGHLMVLECGSQIITHLVLQAVFAKFGMLNPGSIEGKYVTRAIGEIVDAALAARHRRGEWIPPEE